MSLASPHDVAGILGHTAATGIAVILTKLMRYALMVDSPAIGSGANAIDANHQEDLQLQIRYTF